jgi:hypothetical protein
VISIECSSPTASLAGAKRCSTNRSNPSFSSQDLDDAEADLRRRRQVKIDPALGTLLHPELVHHSPVLGGGQLSDVEG